MRLFPAKTPKPVSTRRQPLHAAIARRGARAPAIEEEEEEPTTSFKTTLIVAILLHVVAAGGIFMFESIKKRHPNAFETTPPPVTQRAAIVAPARPAGVQARASATPAAVAALETKKPTPASVVKDSGKLYTVGSGETPTMIAKKLQVSYDDLLKLNKIDDPKKLRAGQKLHIPLKVRASTN